MSTSMAMCLNALGLKCNEDEVNEVMGARPMKGAAWESALACAQHYGCRATLTTPSTLKQVKSWTDAGNPVMIAWNPEGRPWSHASVIFDVDDDFNVYVADPNIPDPDETVRIVPKKDFYKMWYEKWPNYLVRRPALKLEREVSPDGRQVLASAAIQVGSWVKFKRGLRSLGRPLEVLDVGTDWVMVWYQGGEKRIPLHLVEPTSETGQTQKDRDRIQTEALEEWDAVALQRAVKEFGSGVNLRPATWDQITRYNKAMKSGWVVLKGSKTVGYIWVGSRARDKRKALRAIPATDSDVTTKQGSPLRLQRDYGEDGMLNIEEMEKTLKKSSNMVTLKTWEHQHSRPEIREVPYKHAMIKEAKLFKNKRDFESAYPKMPRNIKPDANLFLRRDGCPFCGFQGWEYDGSHEMKVLFCYNCYAEWEVKRALNPEGYGGDSPIKGIQKTIRQPEPWRMSTWPIDGSPLQRVLYKAQKPQSWDVINMHASLKEGADQSPKAIAKWTTQTRMSTEEMENLLKTAENTAGHPGQSCTQSHPTSSHNKWFEEEGEEDEIEDLSDEFELMAFDDSEMFEEDETQDEIENLSDGFELMALDDFEMSVNTFPHL